jgi:hypothetical protein
MIHQPVAAKALEEMKREMERLLKVTAAKPKCDGRDHPNTGFARRPRLTTIHSILA